MESLDPLEIKAWVTSQNYEPPSAEAPAVGKETQNGQWEKEVINISTVAS